MILASTSGPTGISPAWSIPFAVLLLCIALMPFINLHWWEKHYPKVALALAAIPAFYYFFLAPQSSPWLIAMEDYLSFIILLTSLFVISGGINIRVNRKATPAANCGLLLIGAIAANVFGTTGASMLLIRPYLRMNRGHIRPYHIVFFIFIVANCGGLLTPIGDPPLFLGYLQGIPFRWTLDHLWPIWSTVIGLLLIIFFIIDAREHARAAREHHHDGGSQVHILGIHNFIFISAVLFAVFRNGTFHAIEQFRASGISAENVVSLLFSREIIMIVATILSRRLTTADVYRHNEFNYAPIREVAILFIGIFSTMAPALGWLNENAEKLPIKSPTQFYFMTGSLSAALDNAPTYLTFLELRLAEVNASDVNAAEAAVHQMRQSGRIAVPADVPDGDPLFAVEELISSHKDRIGAGTVDDGLIRIAFLTGVNSLNAFLVAISAGAVLFGACTYIGNGPNFMVKSIAESAGVKMPSFVGYVLVYTLPILMPLYLIVWYAFIR